jgi:hypothetical protein
MGTWRNILNNQGPDVDVFCHLWDFNTDPNCVPGRSAESKKIDPKEIDELLTVLRPKKFIVESEKTFNVRSPNQAISYYPYMSQYYSIMKAARLKKAYELENDMMYDVVLRSRYDAYYQSNVSEQYRSVLPETMHGFHLGWDPEIHRGRMGDICWFSDSNIYNIIADFYLNMGTIDKKWFTTNTQFYVEWVFFHYLKKNKIKLENNNWQIKLFRQSEDLVFSKDQQNGFELW